MTIEFFNVLWIYILEKCLFGFRFDTSIFPFSIIVRLFPFYKANFWYNADYEYDKEHGIMNYRIDLIIPFVCDLVLIKQV